MIKVFIEYLNGENNVNIYKTRAEAIISVKKLIKECEKSIPIINVKFLN